MALAMDTMNNAVREIGRRTGATGHIYECEITSPSHASLTRALAVAMIIYAALGAVWTSQRGPICKK